MHVDPLVLGVYILAFTPVLYVNLRYLVYMFWLGTVNADGEVVDREGVVVDR